MDSTMKEICDLKTPVLLLNPKESRERIQLFQKAPIVKYTPCYWLATSGSHGFPKLVGHSYKGLIESARLVMQEFALSERDRWLNVLPTFHVSGLTILARAHISGASVYFFGQRWDVDRFKKTLEQEQITHTSLVPTQIYDLVHQGCKAPQSLKNIFVGGAALSQELYDAACALGWHLTCCYGMSETAAFFSYSKTRDNNGEPIYTLLNGVSATTSSEGLLRVKTPGLAQCILQHNGSIWEEVLIDDSDDGFETGDYAKMLSETDFYWLGRSGLQKKVLGELVDLNELNRLWKSVFAIPGELRFIKDSRAGYQVYAQTSPQYFEVLQSRMSQFCAELRPFERPVYIEFKRGKLDI